MLWMTVAVVAGVALLLWFEHRKAAAPNLTRIAVGVAGLVWLLDVAWMQLDSTGAGGAFDCWPSCSFTQRLAGWGFSLPPLAIAALLVGSALRAVLVAAGTRRRHPIR